VKLGLCDGVSVYGVIRLVWKTGWMFHWVGSSSQTAIGEMILVILNGPWRRGANLAVL
jgi:hypothetical protein